MPETDGVRAFLALRTSKHYAFIDALTVEAEVAERCFLPPPQIDPTDRKAWRRGFERAQQEAKDDD